MKKIVFDKISIRNFLSFGDEPTELEFKNGVTFITGTNYDKNSKNGVGKTALAIESISYALFGVTNRKILVSNVRNWRSKEPCIIQLWFSVNEDRYELIRSTNPTKLILYKNPHLYTDKAEADISKTIPQTNKDILDILGISKEIFTNTLVMTNKSVAFLDQDTTPKTRFIEGILSLEVFSKMFEKVNTSFKAIDKKVDAVKIRIDETVKLIDKDTISYQIEEDNMVNLVTKYHSQIDTLRASTFSDQSEAIKTTTDELESINPILEELYNKFGVVSTKHSKLKDALAEKQKNFKLLTNKTCPTCKRPFDTHLDETMVSEKEQLYADIPVYAAAVDKVSKIEATVNFDILTNKQKQQQLSDTIKKLNVEHNNFVLQESRISSIEKNINELYSKPNPFAERIVTSKGVLEEYHKELAVLENELRIYQALKFATSASGIKATVIKKIISILNSRINYYLSRLDAPVRIEFDEFFEDKILTDDGIEISYGSLSGGEAKRVDFAMLFAFRDIRRLQSGTTFNISVFDELFDSAIDGKAMQDIMGLLMELSEKECFLIITHRPENIEIDNCDTIILEKRNRVTRMIK